MTLHRRVPCIRLNCLLRSSIARPPFIRDASLKENDLSFGFFKHFCSTFVPTRIFAFSHPPPKSPSYFSFLVFALWPIGFNKGNPWGHECGSSQWIVNNSAVIALQKIVISSPPIVSLSYHDSSGPLPHLWLNIYISEFSLVQILYKQLQLLWLYAGHGYSFL